MKDFERLLGGLTNEETGDLLRQTLGTIVETDALEIIRTWATENDLLGELAEWEEVAE